MVPWQGRQTEGSSEEGPRRVESSPLPDAEGAPEADHGRPVCKSRLGRPRGPCGPSASGESFLRVSVMFLTFPLILWQKENEALSVHLEQTPPEPVPPSPRTTSWGLTTCFSQFWTPEVWGQGISRDAIVPPEALGEGPSWPLPALVPRAAPPQSPAPSCHRAPSSPRGSVPNLPLPVKTPVQWEWAFLDGLTELHPACGDPVSKTTACLLGGHGSTHDTADHNFQFIFSR